MNKQFYFKGPNLHELGENSGKFEVFFENQRKPKMVSVRNFWKFLDEVESKGYKLVVGDDQSTLKGEKFDNWEHLRSRCSGSDLYVGLNNSQILITK